MLAVLGEYDEAATDYQRALELIRRAGDRRREIEILVGLSAVYNYAHQGEPAVEYNE